MRDYDILLLICVLYSSEKDFFWHKLISFFQPWEKGKTGYLDETAYERIQQKLRGVRNNFFPLDTFEGNLPKKQGWFFFVNATARRAKDAR